MIYQLRRKTKWKWIKGKKEGEEIRGEGGWEDEKEDMKVQGQSCKDTLTMARFHQANRMVTRGTEKEQRGEEVIIQ